MSSPSPNKTCHNSRSSSLQSLLPLDVILSQKSRTMSGEDHVFEMSELHCSVSSFLETCTRWYPETSEAIVAQDPTFSLRSVSDHSTSTSSSQREDLLPTKPARRLTATHTSAAATTSCSEEELQESSHSRHSTHGIRSSTNQPPSKPCRRDTAEHSRRPSVSSIMHAHEEIDEETFRLHRSPPTKPCRRATAEHCPCQSEGEDHVLPRGGRRSMDLADESSR